MDHPFRWLVVVAHGSAQHEGRFVEQRVEQGAMRERADVDETLQPAEISGRLLNELYTHALESWPEECCGLILGVGDDRYQRLVRCRNEMTHRHQTDPIAYPRDGREAYYMNEHDYLREIEKADAEALSVTAVYHSHVGGAVYLSEMDLRYAQSELFPFPDAEQIVVSVSERKVRGLGLFRRVGRDAPFIGRPVEPLT
ncbi:MAG: Mov34/MPN/PAD-1 family protein [Deltaproteobacteria bacterium]|nr:Mov34/MPN/PAD-1 family protein [Deltaproteobacteria bacterium]